MKTIGLLGGMSWQSTVDYYRLINEKIQERIGGLHSAKILLYSVDFAPIEKLQRQGNWTEAGEILASHAKRLENTGAEFLLICTNTMHRVADMVAEQLSIPLLHIADTTGQHLNRQGKKRVGLLGTRFTMEQEFYRGRLESRFGLQVTIPKHQDRQIVHRVIFEELCVGRRRQESKQEYLRIIDQLQQDGTQAVILGCTEIGMLVDQSDTSVPLLDTTHIHALAAVERALE